MNGAISDLLTDVKAGLEELYGPRLQGVYLYGSYARGEQTEESDVDVLIVLDCVNHYAAEIEHTGYLVSPISLKYGVSVSRVIISGADWEWSRSQFFENV